MSMAKNQLLLYSVLVCFCECVCMVSAQELTNCSALRVGSIGLPLEGINLPVCGNIGTAQCCTRNYLRNTAKGAAVQALREALREELRNRERDYGNIVNRLTNYLLTDFLDQTIHNFPIVEQFTNDTFLRIFSDVLADLRENFIISSSTINYNVAAQFFQLINDRIIGNVAAQFFQLINDPIIGNVSLIRGNTTEQQACIINTIWQNINISTTQRLPLDLEVVRQSLSSLIRIKQFLSQYHINLHNFIPIAGCVQRFAELSFCGRCTKRIPPLCRNTCNALVRGCLSPYYSGLYSDFRQLWNVSVQILTGLNATIGEFFVLQTQIINVTNVPLQVLTNCGLIPNPWPNNFRSRNLDIGGVLDDLVAELKRLDGAFQYDPEGPQFCRPSSDKEDYCHQSIQRDSKSERDCDPDKICTSECECWDGTMMRDTNTPAFNRGSQIQDQVRNPELTGIRQDDLNTRAKQLGTPANDFLTSDELSSIVPEGVSIPPASPYTSTGGAVKTVFTLWLLLIGAILGCAL